MIHHSPGLHFKHHKYFQHKELDALYVSAFIKTIADSLISIFTAIFLLEHGHSVPQVAWFYSIYFTLVALCVPLARQLSANIGLKKTLALGLLVLAIFYYVLPQTGAIPYQLIAAIYGVGAGLYYASFHVDLAQALRGSKSQGASLAILRIISIAAGIAGPLLGALVIARGSFNLLFAVVGALLLMSLVPLFIVGDHTVAAKKLSLRKIIRSDSKSRAAVYVFHGANESGLDILWPAFIYLNFSNILSIGGMLSTTTFALMILIYIAGKYTDRNEVESYRIGVFTHAPTWVLKLILLSPGGLFLTNFLGTATAYMVDIPFYKAVFDSARGYANPADYFLFKEAFTWLGRVGMLLLAVLVADFSVIFVVVTLIAFAHVMLVPELKRMNRAGAS